jgi:hypothetical protein
LILVATPVVVAVTAAGDGTWKERDRPKKDAGEREKRERGREGERGGPPSFSLVLSHLSHTYKTQHMGALYAYTHLPLYSYFARCFPHSESLFQESLLDDFSVFYEDDSDSDFGSSSSSPSSYFHPL